VAEFYFQFQLWHPPFSGGPSYVSSCKISAKSDNRRPSYGDSNNSRWPLSAILDYGWKRIWIIPDVAGPIIYVHTKFDEDTLIGGWDYPKTEFENAPWRRNFTSGFNFDALSSVGTFVHVIVQNFSQIGWLVAELYRFYHFTLLGPILGPLSLPSVRGSAPPSKTAFCGPQE